jgi:hypothetical protein
MGELAFTAVSIIKQANLSDEALDLELIRQLYNITKQGKERDWIADQKSKSNRLSRMGRLNTKHFPDKETL